MIDNSLIQTIDLILNGSKNSIFFFAWDPFSNTARLKDLALS